MKIWIIFPALGALAVLTVFAAKLLESEPGARDTLPSALIGREVPPIEFPGLGNRPGLSAADFKTPGVKLLNFWGSWCAPCRQEHPKLMELAAEGVTIHSINQKDVPENAEAFLRDLGDPYTRIGTDRTGRASLEFGVYGVPETFVIDGQGRIRYRHVGPVLDRNIDRLREEIRKAGDE